MTDRNDDPTAQNDDCRPILDRNVDRRTALKGGAAGLAAIGLGGFASGSAVAGHSANKVAAAGSDVTALRVESANGRNISRIGDLLGPLEVKTSRNPSQALSLQPTIESSLFTNVFLDKDPDADETGDESEAEAGVLGWIEVNGDATDGQDKLVTVTGDLVDAPENAADLIEGGGSQNSFVDTGPGDESLIASEYRAGVVAFDTRAYRMQWNWEDPEDDDEEVDDEEMEAHLRTRSAHGFGWIAPVQGDNTITFKGVTYVYTDDPEAEAVAFVGNRTMMIDPLRLHHEVQSDEDEDEAGSGSGDQGRGQFLSL